jgi:hypothetical protein
MMNLTVEVFRQQVQERRGARRRGAPRYPADLVAFAVKHARASQTAGRSLAAAAAELGLSSMTLGTWLSRAGQSTGQRLREVVVREATAEASPCPRTVEVQTASGHVVRGLSVADASALLRALT